MTLHCTGNQLICQRPSPAVAWSRSPGLHSGHSSVTARQKARERCGCHVTAGCPKSAVLGGYTSLLMISGILLESPRHAAYRATDAAIYKLQANCNTCTMSRATAPSECSALCQHKHYGVCYLQHNIQTPAGQSIVCTILQSTHAYRVGGEASADWIGS